LHATPQASMAFLNTQLACGTASVTWMIIDLYCRGVPSFDGIMNGSIAGLVAITPCAGYVDTTGAFIVGFLGGAITSQGVKIKEYFNFDDALDAFGIHGVAGVTGMVMSGLLAKSEISGAPSDQQGIFYGGSFNFLGVQLVAIVFTVSWGCLFTAIILKLVDKVIGLRVSQYKELIGLDA
jgi:Amt family ammonium transporter